jgi:hypothetical protein
VTQQPVDSPGSTTSNQNEYHTHIYFFPMFNTPFAKSYHCPNPI